VSRRCPRCGGDTVGDPNDRRAICGCPKAPRTVDFENLKRVIIAGSADAARDAGLVHFVISVSVDPALVTLPTGPEIAPEIKIEIVELSDEQAAELRGQESN
jgi:hypothetical protein